jgi:chromosome segregation ATPase
MKHVVIALLLGIGAVLVWTHMYHPQEWESWTLQIEREIASLTEKNREEVEERWFSFQRDSLLEKYAAAEKEYEVSKLSLEGEFGEVKNQLESQGVDDSTIEIEVAKFQEKIEEKRALFEQRKAEIEEKIAEIKRQYEETRATLQALNDSINKVRDGVTESVDAIEELRGSVAPVE